MGFAFRCDTPSEVDALHDPVVGAGLASHKAGAALPDPDGRLEGTGARLRHVKVRSVDEAREPALGALIEAALAERRTALG